MASLFSSPKTPKVPAPPPPTPVADEETVKAAKERARTAARARGGRASTLLSRTEKLGD